MSTFQRFVMSTFQRFVIKPALTAFEVLFLYVWTRFLGISEFFARAQNRPNSWKTLFFFQVSCDDEHCSLKHSSHVHCLQCEFTCTETAKIATHRRSHSKQSAVAAAGFDKFSFRAPCGVPSCLYYTQTHYHCKTCSVVVNTMSQMQMHQGKHDLGYVENSEQSLDIIGDW